MPPPSSYHMTAPPYGRGGNSSEKFREIVLRTVNVQPKVGKTKMCKGLVCLLVFLVFLARLFFLQIRNTSTWYIQPSRRSSRSVRCAETDWNLLHNHTALANPHTTDCPPLAVCKTRTGYWKGFRLSVRPRGFLPKYLFRVTNGYILVNRRIKRHCLGYWVDRDLVAPYLWKRRLLLIGWGNKRFQRDGIIFYRTYTFISLVSAWP